MSDFLDCQNCGVTIHRHYETFPGNICLVCHAKEEETKPMPTAQDIRQMWGNPMHPVYAQGGLLHRKMLGLEGGK
jgi:hypothetical protein